MGERKGTNKWYPPDWHPDKHSNLNKYWGTHALRERARKIGQGIIIIRFEMPYNIWCEGCGNHIGMGVRYNAEKKKVGNYYSTTIWQFRMKCHLCDNHFEIKTDPANLDYVIVSGARRQEKRFDPKENGQVVPDDRDTIKKLATDAMFKLEHVEEDRSKGKDAKASLASLEDFQFGRWKDDHEANRIMRDKFRESKRELARGDAADKVILDRGALELKLLPETAEDRSMAHSIVTGRKESYEEMERAKLEALRRQSVFAKKKRESLEASAARKVLKSTILEVMRGRTPGNGAAALHPDSVSRKRNAVGVVVRAQSQSETDSGQERTGKNAAKGDSSTDGASALNSAAPGPHPLPSLVSYGSDSDNSE